MDVRHGGRAFFLQCRIVHQRKQCEGVDCGTCLPEAIRLFLACSQVGPVADPPAQVDQPRQCGRIARVELHRRIEVVDRFLVLFEAHQVRTDVEQASRVGRIQAQRVDMHEDGLFRLIHQLQSFTQRGIDTAVLAVQFQRLAQQVLSIPVLPPQRGIPGFLQDGNRLLLLGAAGLLDHAVPQGQGKICARVARHGFGKCLLQLVSALRTGRRQEMLRLRIRHACTPFWNAFAGFTCFDLFATEFRRSLLIFS